MMDNKDLNLQEGKKGVTVGIDSLTILSKFCVHLRHSTHVTTLRSNISIGDGAERYSLDLRRPEEIFKMQAAKISIVLLFSLPAVFSFNYSRIAGLYFSFI